MKNMLVVILLVLLPSLTIADEPAPPAFGSPMSYLVGDDPRSITTSDLNGDGILDAFIANEDSDDAPLPSSSSAAPETAFSCGGARGTPYARERTET